MSAVLGATSTITTLVGETFDMITSNPLLCVFVAASLIGVGISVLSVLSARLADPFPA